MTDAPRALRDPAARERRRAMLAEPHIAPLAAYAGLLRAQGCGEVPDFDPLDGGVNAQTLFLMEKPGPMTAATRAGRAGSGFVSRDNDDPTAEATLRFMQEAGVDRRQTVIWNVIPWWNGTIQVTRAEQQAGLAELTRLLPLLPRLHTAVLVGRTARAARGVLDTLRLLESAHPSPQVRAGNRALWDAIPAQWLEAAAHA